MTRSRGRPLPSETRKSGAAAAASPPRKLKKEVAEQPKKSSTKKKNSSSSKKKKKQQEDEEEESSSEETESEAESSEEEEEEEEEEVKPKPKKGGTKRKAAPEAKKTLSELFPEEKEEEKGKGRSAGRTHANARTRDHTAAQFYSRRTSMKAPAVPLYGEKATFKEILQEQFPDKWERHVPYKDKKTGKIKHRDQFRIRVSDKAAECAARTVADVLATCILPNAMQAQVDSYRGTDERKEEDRVQKPLLPSHIDSAMFDFADHIDAWSIQTTYADLAKQLDAEHEKTLEQGRVKSEPQRNVDNWVAQLKTLDALDELSPEQQREQLNLKYHIRVFNHAKAKRALERALKSKQTAKELIAEYTSTAIPKYQKEIAEIEEDKLPVAEKEEEKANKNVNKARDAKKLIKQKVDDLRKLIKETPPESTEEGEARSKKLTALKKELEEATKARHAADKLLEEAHHKVQVHKNRIDRLEGYIKTKENAVEEARKAIQAKHLKEDEKKVELLGAAVAKLRRLAKESHVDLSVEPAVKVTNKKKNGFSKKKKPSTKKKGGAKKEDEDEEMPDSKEQEEEEKGEEEEEDEEEPKAKKARRETA